MKIEPETEIRPRSAGGRPAAPVLAALLAVFVLPATGTAQDATPPVPAAGDVVELRFHWPVGTAADVAISQERLQEADGEESGFEMEGTYTFIVEPHKSGLLVRNKPARTTRFETRPPSEEGDPMERLLAGMSGITAHYVVDESGMLVDVEGVDEMANALVETLTPMLDSLPDGGAEARALLDQMVGRDQLLAQIDGQWGLMVAFWVDSDLGLGESFEYEDQIQSPVLPDTWIPTQVSFSAVERVPCRPEAPAGPADCVVLEWTSQPDPEVATEVIAEFLESLGPQAAGVSMDIEQRHTARLVTEPGTLLPHHFTTATEMVGTVSAMGQTSDLVQFDAMELTFTYTRRP